MQLEEAQELPGKQKKNVVVAVGRFNPPTRGHYKVINAMKAFIRDNPDLNLDTIPVVVIVAGSKSDQDKSRNPLSGDERKTFMESSGRANGVKFLIAPSAFAAFAEVRNNGMEPIAVAAGSDRLPGYLKMLDDYFTHDGTPAKSGGKKITHYSVPGLDRDADADADDGDSYYQKIIDMIVDGDKVNDDMISGSLARFAVRKNEPRAFAYIVGLEKKPKLSEKMFDKIKEAQTS